MFLFIVKTILTSNECNLNLHAQRHALSLRYEKNIDRVHREKVGIVKVIIEYIVKGSNYRVNC